MRIRHSLNNPVVSLTVRELCKLYHLYPIGRIHRIKDDEDGCEVYVDNGNDQIEVHINKETRCYWIATPNGGCI